MENLTQILWRERELRETLLFKLCEEQLVLAAGRTRWLMRAACEVENVLAMIRETEILRAVAVDEAAAALGVGHNATLRALVEAADEPWQSILADHHDAFTSATWEAVALADSVRDLVTRGRRSASEPDALRRSQGARGATSRIRPGRLRLQSASPRVEKGDSQERAVERDTERQIEQAAYETALVVTARAVQPGLLDFLR